MIFAAAVENGAIASSPVVGVKIPREQRREIQVLTPEQVAAVARAVPARYQALVYLLAYGGLRWGEAASLRRGRINILRGRIKISGSVAETSRGLHHGPTKTYQTRSVAIPQFLKDMLRAILLSSLVQVETRWFSRLRMVRRYETTTGVVEFANQH
jgi:integrase